MPQISPASTPRVTVSVPVPEPVAKPQKSPAAPAAPSPQAQPAQGQYPPPPWARPPEPEFQPRQFVEAHSLIFPYSAPPRQQFRPQGPLPFSRRRFTRISSLDPDFQAAILAEPANALHHLVYADYLEEQGKPVHAEMIRRAVNEHEPNAFSGTHFTVQPHQIAQDGRVIPRWEDAHTPPGSTVSHPGSYGNYLTIRPYEPNSHGSITYYVRHTGDGWPNIKPAINELHQQLEAEGANQHATRQPDPRRRMARHGKPARFAAYRPEEIARTIRQEPANNPIMADLLEENDQHADQDTLDHLRSGTHGWAVVTPTGKVKAGPHRTIDDIRTQMTAGGSHWWDRDTMRFFGTRVGGKTFTGPGGTWFVTSDHDFDRQRGYTLRHFDPIYLRDDGSLDPAGEIDTIGEVADRTRSRAQLERLAARFAQEPSPVHARVAMRDWADANNPVGSLGVSRVGLAYWLYYHKMIPQDQMRAVMDRQVRVIPNPDGQGVTLQPVANDPERMARHDRPVRYSARDLAAGIAVDKENRLAPLVLADWLDENGHTGAGEVVRRAMQHAEETGNYDRAPDVYRSHWITESNVRAAENHPHGLTTWTYGDRGPFDSGFLFPNLDYETTKIALGLLTGHPGGPYPPTDEKAGRHFVQFHTGPLPAEDAHRILTTMGEEGVPNAHHFRRRIEDAHPEIEPWRMARHDRPRRFAGGGYSPQDVVNTLRTHPDHGPILADYLEENDLHATPSTLHTLRSGNPAYAEVQNGKVYAQGMRTPNDYRRDPGTLAYLDAALWSSTDDEGHPLDENHSLHSLSPWTLNEMASDWMHFYVTLPEHLQDAISGHHDQAGHDFWLTRNGHGAGFWDGDWGEHGDELTDHVRRHFGEYDLYVGDDGQIHGHGYRRNPDDPVRRYTRPLTKQEKIRRLKGRHIKRAIASGDHPDRKTAVLAGIAAAVAAASG